MENENESKSKRKAVLSHRIFLKGLTPEEVTRLDNELTYKIWQNPLDRFPLIRKHCKKENASVYSIPRARLDLVPSDYEISSKLISVPVKYPKPRISLREEQEYFVRNVVQPNAVSLLNAKPGWGKTFTALWAAYESGEKALVVCTNTNIRQMWVGEVEKLFGFTPGIIGSGKLDTSTPIVISNIQTLSNKYEQVRNLFGMLIIDECHHCPAKTFADIVGNSPASKVIGLSGTLKRKDKLEVLFKDWFSTNIYSPPADNVLPCVVHLIDSNCRFSDNSEKPWALRETEVYESEEYLAELKLLVASYYAKGAKILLTLNRVAGMDFLVEGFDKSIVINGNTPLEAREAFLTSLYEHDGPALVVATQAIFAEGVSCNPLDTLILGTSINAEVTSLVEQIVARVRRKFKEKTHATVVDICLAGNSTKNHRRQRVEFYKEQGFVMLPKTLKNLLTST